MYDARRRTDQGEEPEQEPDFEDHDAEAEDYYKDQVCLSAVLPAAPSQCHFLVTPWFGSITTPVNQACLCKGLACVPDC